MTGGALTGLQRLLQRLPWGCARGTRYTPGCHITGFQPSETGSWEPGFAFARALGPKTSVGNSLGISHWSFFIDHLKTPRSSRVARVDRLRGERA
ncbi:hypothetical protein SBV1_1300018 [Verrucomicrobia bacterium]|nr:hypothetical protein SBV1_1300018 [Verrucomicrobiota bacterium]